MICPGISVPDSMSWDLKVRQTGLCRANTTLNWSNTNAQEHPYYEPERKRKRKKRKNFRSQSVAVLFFDESERWPKLAPEKPLLKTSWFVLSSPTRLVENEGQLFNSHRVSCVKMLTISRPTHLAPAVTSTQGVVGLGNKTTRQGENSVREMS